MLSRGTLLGVGSGAILGGAPWSPSTPGGLAGWWKADVGVTTSGANVTAWADQSGNGRNFGSAGGSEPQFSATGWNGALPGIRHVPNDYFFQDANGLTSLINGTNVAMTTAMTIKMESGGTTRSFYEWHEQPGISEGLRLSLDANNRCRVDTFAGANAVGTATADGFRRIVWIFKSTANVDVYVDGVLEINNASLAHSFTALNRILNGMTWNAAFGLDGVVAEWNISSGAWSAGAVSSYQTYSVNKWGGVGSPMILASSAISTDTNATGATNTIPSGTPAANEVIWAHVTITNSSTSVITPPAGEGWTLASRGDDVAGAGCTCAVYWKRWGTGSTDNTSVAFTGTSGNMRLVLGRLKGCKTSGNPYTAAANGGGGGAGTGTTLTAPTATGASQQRAMRFYSGSATGINIAPNGMSSTYGGASYGFTAGVDGACACGDLTSDANPTGTATATSSGTLSNGWAAVTVTFTAA